MSSIINVKGVGKVDIESLAEIVIDKEMTYLDLSNNVMGCSTLRYVADILKHTEVNTLALNNNKIGCNGLKCLADVLKDTQITHLSLRKNNIRNEGFIYLVEILNDTKIRELNLEANEIDLESDHSRLTDALKLTQLTHLNLSNNKIRCSGLIHLAKILRNSKISSLNLSNNDLRNDDVKYLADTLKHMQMNELNLRCNNIGFEAAEYLNDQLFNLECLFSDVSDAENGKPLISQSNFMIEFFGCNVGRVGARYVQKRFCEKGISVLELKFHFRDCTEDDIYYLSQAFHNIKIKKLILLSEYFTQSCDIDYLFKIFQKSNIMQFCADSKLSTCHIRYLAEFLKKVKLLELSISRNRLKDKAIKILVPALKNNNIMELDLSGNNITSKGAKYLSEILKDSKVVSLNLCDCKIRIEGAKYLANGLLHSQVTEINLDGNMIGCEGYQALTDVVAGTYISRANLGASIYEKEETDSGKLEPCNMSTSTPKTACKIEETFRNLVSSSSDGEELEFIVPKKENDCNRLIDIHQYAFLIGTLKNHPNSKVHIFYKIYRTGLNDYDFDAIEKTDNFIENITNKFTSFFESKLPDLLDRFSNEDYVHFVKQFEEFKLSDVVQHLLRHRVLYYVDENQEILHPYIYKLLNKYNLPLYNSVLEPSKKTKKISYYENHKEIDGSQEIIDMLKPILM